MITVSKKIEYSVAVVTFLAKRQTGLVSLAKACRQLNLPYRFLARIVGRLKQADILTSKEGKEGGYGLARGWEKKSLYDLFEALGENKRMVRCLAHKGECGREKGCKIKSLWLGLEKVLIKELKEIKLGEIK